MANYGDEFGTAGRRTDEYGNPINGGTGQYGTGTGAHAVGTGAHGIGTGTHGTQGTGEKHGVGGLLHRSGSSSSSSSEDDGMGGRRKKGLKQKIKEKLPGGQKDQNDPNYGTTGNTTTGQKIKEKLPGIHNDQNDPNYGTAGYGTTGHGTTGTTGYGHGVDQQEKKGVVEKIKEKLPGGNQNDPNYGTTGYGKTGHGTTGAGYGTTGHGTTGTTGYGHGVDQQEKKGVVEKIKEKLPGGNQNDPNYGTAGYGTTGHGTTGAGYGTTGHGTTGTTGYGHGVDQQEKKGVVEKIKEKLPGGNR